MNEILDKTSCNTQLYTFLRIIKSKPYKGNINHVDQFIKNNKNINYYDNNYYIIIKSCPHCKKKFVGSNKTNYVICGYNYNGYDWKGCGRDWCFKCCKKLCKSWNHDLLYILYNRFHDHQCCKKYALYHQESYDQYCVCVNLNVCRIM